MASQGAYKSYQRSPRQINVEEIYTGGMVYTDTPQMEGSCKVMTNFDLKDKGAVLIPRAGLRVLHSEELPLGVTQHTYMTGLATVNNTGTDEDLSRRYLFFACDGPDDNYFDFMDASTLIEDSFTPMFDEGSKDFVWAAHTLPAKQQFFIRRGFRSVPQMLHNLSLLEEGAFSGEPYLPIQAQLNNIPVLPVKYIPNTDTPAVFKTGFATMNISVDAMGAYSSTLTFLEPKEITPTTAVNYGYNMLSSAPYQFADTLEASVAANYIILQGIVPYSDPTCLALKFNAKVGEWITFRLYANYPDTTSTYKFRWEFRDLVSDAITVYEDQATTSNLYAFDGTKAHDNTHNTDYVKLTLQPPYKQFSVTVTAYVPADLTKPVQVITLGSYSISADTAGSTYGIAPRTYALSTATHMCAWRQRIVLWGIPGAPNMLFFSEVNDPSYFPYPNNAEIFEEEIISCVPYLGNLLVFTATQLHKMTLSSDGLSYKNDLIQNKLSLTNFDYESVLLVQNMVYFKSGNYYYLMVPRTSATAQADALQLAPISTPISYLLDHFATEVKEIVFKLYNPYDSTRFTRVNAGSEYSLQIQDYYNYLDGTIIRNVYKYNLVTRITDTQAIDENIMSFDFVLCYDTLTRVWNTYIYQSNASRLMPYRQTVTDATVFVAIDQGSSSRVCQFIKPDSTNMSDNFVVLGADPDGKNKFFNFQMLDTGYRDQQFAHKKRYREIQFAVNVLSQQSLQFGTEFLLDNQIRKDLFKNEVRQVTDPDEPDYGWIYVERVFDEAYITGGAAILDDDVPTPPYIPGEKVTIDDSFVLQSSKWVLDVSQLAPVSTAKIRMPVSGKGFAPRFTLISFNEVPFELLNHAWVYRMMNAR